jgi:hypothetical protein
MAWAERGFSTIRPDPNDGDGKIVMSTECTMQPNAGLANRAPSACVLRPLGGTEHVRYRPLNLGFRFSRNAVVPSCLSSDP